VILLLLIALLALVVFGVGFTAHWLFIVAAILVGVWLLTLSWAKEAAAAVAPGAEASKQFGFSKTV
jgi:heme O synthase-like polyprenyltransferase